MAQKNRSQVVPVLIAALICDVAVADPSTKKQNLIGIFDRIQVGSFPTGRPFSLYVKLADAEGHYDVSFRFVRSDTGEQLAEVTGNLDSQDRLASTDLHINFPPLALPAAGRYEFQVWVNDMFLGSTFINAELRQQPPQRGGG